jgi:hypothetical protein
MQATTPLVLIPRRAAKRPSKPLSTLPEVIEDLCQCTPAAISLAARKFFIAH